jgi:dTDP-4-dehydrorhamnose reductase
VIPVSSGEFAAKAKRPRNSVLDNSRLQRELGVALDDWRSELRNVLARLAR